jgi:hypothetical protein
VWRRLTWDQFTKATKFFVGLGWGTLELAVWGARPSSLLFIGGVLVGTEGATQWVRLRSLAGRPEEERSSVST